MFTYNGSLDANLPRSSTSSFYTLRPRLNSKSEKYPYFCQKCKIFTVSLPGGFLKMPSETTAPTASSLSAPSSASLPKDGPSTGNPSRIFPRQKLKIQKLTPSPVTPASGRISSQSSTWMLTSTPRGLGGRTTRTSSKSLRPEWTRVPLSCTASTARPRTSTPGRRAPLRR